MTAPRVAGGMLRAAWLREHTGAEPPKTLRSGRRDSNSRRPAWKAGALPTELHPQNCLRLLNSNAPQYNPPTQHTASTPQFPPIAGAPENTPPLETTTKRKPHRVRTRSPAATPPSPKATAAHQLRPLIGRATRGETLKLHFRSRTDPLHGAAPIGRATRGEDSTPAFATVIRPSLQTPPNDRATRGGGGRAGWLRQPNAWGRSPL